MRHCPHTPRIITSLATKPWSCPMHLSRSFLARVPRIVTLSNHQPRPSRRRVLARPRRTNTSDKASSDTFGNGGGVMGWEEGLVAVKRIVMVSCRIFSRRKQNHQIRHWGGMSNSSHTQCHDTKPSAGIIAHGVGVTTMPLLGASSAHR